MLLFIVLNAVFLLPLKSNPYVMIQLEKIDHIQICIPKEKEVEARAFYTGILGLVEIPKPEALLKNGGLWYQLKDIELHIGTETVENHSKQHPAFQVKNIQQIKQYLLKEGVRIRENTPIPGCERFDFYDPFNNRIELVEKVNQVSNSALQFWQDFQKVNPEYKYHSIPQSYYFCDTKESADYCAQLVKDSVKTATCGAQIDYQIEGDPLPKAGELFIITDWEKIASSIIKITDVTLRKFKDVDADFAAREGEGDRSLEYWREVHWDFFSRYLAAFGIQPTEELVLVCECFEKIY